MVDGVEIDFKREELSNGSYRISYCGYIYAVGDVSYEVVVSRRTVLKHLDLFFGSPLVLSNVMWLWFVDGLLRFNGIRVISPFTVVRYAS